MKTIFDFPEDLVEDEIISKLPISSLRSVRSTCKKWNTLCKNRIFLGKEAEAKKQFLLMDSGKICLMNLHLGKDNGGEPSITEVSVIDKKIEISKVFQCDGLLLCFLSDCSRLLVWNPYLGQTRWIQPRNSFHSSDRFALGYDRNLNYKILRIFDEIHPVTDRNVLGIELYDFSSCSWKVLVVTQDWFIWSHVRGVSLKGNAYFPTSFAGFFVCFDFTTESFGPYLPLPFQHDHGGCSESLSCVREDQKLAVLYQQWVAPEIIEISITDKIGPDVVSWTKFLKVVTSIRFQPCSGSFFIDEEKKVAVVFVLEKVHACWYQTAHVIGQDGYIKSVRLREVQHLENTSSYFPSLVQIKAAKQG